MELNITAIGFFIIVGCLSARENSKFLSFKWVLPILLATKVVGELLALYFYYEFTLGGVIDIFNIYLFLTVVLYSMIFISARILTKSFTKWKAKQIGSNAD